MAKTIMVADRVYNELKARKGTDRSFSDVIIEALEARPRKTIAGVIKLAGILQSDASYGDVMRWSRKMWKKWDKQIEKELS